MAYAAEADLEAAWGANTLNLVSLDDATSQRDHARIAAALDAASAFMDGYLARRYALPMALSANGATVLRTLCCDIALARLATSADRMTEIYEGRRAEAIKFMLHVAESKASIDIRPAPGEAVAGPAVSPHEAVLVAEDRVFTRHSLKGM